MNRPEAVRILIVDENRVLHDEYRKILESFESDGALIEQERRLHGETGRPGSAGLEFRVDSAYDGQEALRLVERAAGEQFPYCVAFVDVRMPPGWDALETIQWLWAADPRLQVVLCSARSEYNWKQ